jgi:BlaI family penicillinase repressor
VGPWPGHEALSAGRRIAYTTVLTTLQALERRGVVTHDVVGKAYRYAPAVSREQYTSARVGKLVEDLFDGRKEKLLSHLLGASRISRAELADIRRILRDRGPDGSRK